MVTPFLECPSCGALTEVAEAQTLETSYGSEVFVTLKCLAGHAFFGPADFFNMEIVDVVERS